MLMAIGSVGAGLGDWLWPDLHGIRCTTDPYETLGVD